MKSFFQEYGLSVIVGCVVFVLLAMASPVGGSIKAGFAQTSDSLSNTSGTASAKAGKAVKTLGYMGEIPNTIYVGYNSSAKTLVFSHDEDSAGYSACDTKYGDISNEVYDGTPWKHIMTNTYNTSINIENTIKPKNMRRWFSQCYYVTRIDSINNIDTSNVTDMSYCFNSCSLLGTLNLSSWNTSKVQNMQAMFSGCNRLTSVNLSSFDTSNVVDMSTMFYNCQRLTSIDISNFNTSQVTNMSGMFRICKTITELNLSNFDTRKVQSMQNMFQQCLALETVDYGENFVAPTGSITNMYTDCPANKPSCW